MAALRFAIQPGKAQDPRASLGCRCRSGRPWASSWFPHLHLEQAHVHPTQFVDPQRSKLPQTASQKAEKPKRQQSFEQFLVSPLDQRAFPVVNGKYRQRKEPAAKEPGVETLGLQPE
jgi:hypothetical protein